MPPSSRDDILRALRRTSLEEVPLPALDAPWTEYADCRQQFADVLASVGGQAVVVQSLTELNAHLEHLPAYREARHVCSLIAGIRKANVDLDQVKDPHELENLDFFIAPGALAVAENAAVWVTDQAARHRVAYFIAQHMALVVPGNALLSNLHQAYARLAFDRPHFGLFLSGPSKTADIEQALVIGAHGARSLTVFLMEPSGTG